MDIILVRISKRSGGELYIERKAIATTHDSYIAISHVWGSPDTISRVPIPGVDGDVALSPGKRDILNILQRKDICGNGWFWMDLFCIDQTPNAPISISKQLAAIPAIYKSSTCVKVLIESPICESWTATAANTVLESPSDEEAFLEWELHHSRRCPHMPFLDPWFERLWTRQEGLYGMRLEMVALNSIPCSRIAPARHSVPSAFIHESSMREKRMAALYFVEDKLSYHGLAKSDAEKIILPVYIDLCYRRRAVVESYGGSLGPHATYSPIAGAWTSSRITTKTRDYFLAVFPDVTGYKVPDNPRKMPFEALLADALKQPAVHQRFLIATKVPKGMVSECSDDESLSPWTPAQPNNVAEALDGFLCPARGDSTVSSEVKYYRISSNVTLDPVILSKATLPQILANWSSTTDVNRHVNQLHPAGPCTGSGMHGAPVPAPELLLGQYLSQQFVMPAWRTLGFKANKRIRPLSSESVSQASVPDDVFVRKLQEFLVCLVCGTTVDTAQAVLRRAHLVTVKTPSVELLALVNNDSLQPEEPIMLICTSAWQGQGLLLATRSAANKYHILGRTVIPRNLSDFQATGERPK